MNISFFITEDNGSGICRGIQISERIPGSKVYLKKDINQDLIDSTICIWIKYFKYDHEYLNGLTLSNKFFIDIVDGIHGIGFSKINTNINIIASSKSSFNYLKYEFNNRNIIYIPHHHCNFENKTIPDRPVKTVGFVGDSSLCIFNSSFKDKLKLYDLNFEKLINPKTRESVSEFLYSIDIQLAPVFFMNKRKRLLKNSLKISNGASFKIPTVATPELSYIEDYNDCFIKANSIDSIIDSCKLLKDDESLYRGISEKSFEISKNYHIDKIVGMYNEI